MAQMRRWHLRTAQADGFAEREVETQMFESLTIARRLIDVGVNPEQIDAIRQAAEHGEHLAPDALRAALATQRAETWRAMLFTMAASHPVAEHCKHPHFCASLPLRPFAAERCPRRCLLHARLLGVVHYRPVDTTLGTLRSSYSA